jgi:phosphoribosylaminoimidazolecarboxamide formyltransferase/IMP cyclohydrolase
MNKARTALLSAYRKDNRLSDFAHELVGLGWKLLASAGTKRFLDQRGIPSIDVADLVGPPILGHRVVTLDRGIYAAILARLNNSDDMAELERMRIDPIHLVYVDLYPLAQELASDSCTFDSIIEKVDIGGPTLLRAAAKGDRIVVSSPEQFGRVLSVIRSPLDGAPSLDATLMRRFLSGLAADAEKMVANYAGMSASFHRSVAQSGPP